ncbi:MAG: acetyl-CoA carboxylase biotin carboxyl carrier protein [Erysipelothrix sp.]|nr:acetyl-CoA carboxylase biotin carboxyl carrier protein [Erysipelothrix sp.]
MKDKQTIKTIIDLFESSDVAKMELELEGFKIKLEKAQPVIVHQVQEAAVPTFSSPQPTITSEKSEVTEPVLGHEIKAPLVGTFYHCPSPTSDPFVKVGDRVKKGQVVGIIEAMKVMNEVTSPFEGVITHACTSHNSSVSFGQVLYKVDAHD